MKQNIWIADDKGVSKKRVGDWELYVWKDGNWEAMQAGRQVAEGKAATPSVAKRCATRAYLKTEGWRPGR